jgi:diphthamide synthase (EF-2-diphthine--ammonia ligase)
LSWSSGKDSAWALHELRQRPDLEVVGLLTTVSAAFARVSMHGVRESLLAAQARALALPLSRIELPWPCPNAVYEERFAAALQQAGQDGVTHLAFGDLFLQDVRDYRMRLLSGTGIEPLFPLWCSPAETPALARRMLAAGLRAVLTCVDPKQVPARLAGREFDETLLDELPPGADPCGERGEFHTFCYAGPMFGEPLRIRVGDLTTRDGFRFADLLLETTTSLPP